MAAWPVCLSNYLISIQWLKVYNVRLGGQCAKFHTVFAAQAVWSHLFQLHSLFASWQENGYVYPVCS